MNEVLSAILDRRSVRTYSDRQISDSDINTILDAGKAAPSSLNRQPWHFTVIQNKAVLDSIVRDNREVVLASQQFTKMSPWLNAPNYHNFYNAPTAILISGHTENFWHVCDCALAMQNMSLAAHSLSIGSCIIASIRFLFMSDKGGEYLERLQIPKGFTPLFALTLGHSSAEPPKATPRKADCVSFIK